ncbi:MAG: helix-turn-helix domain-containing protein [Woeseiaceae bacterium]|jgi:AraC-like DNA-binding protein
MQNFETALRLIVIGQDILIAAIFLYGKGRMGLRVSGALLMLSAASYLVASDQLLWNAMGVMAPLVALPAMSTPYFLWLFARAVFESPWPRAIVVVVPAAVVAGVWAIYIAGPFFSPRIVEPALVVLRVVSLFVVAHALWITLTGRPDDLIERRRTFRLFFVGIIAIQVAAVVIVELVLGSDGVPPWLDMANVIIIAILTLILAIPLLRLSRRFFEPATPTVTPQNAEPGDELGAAGQVYCQKLLDLMDSGYYRETGLTIPTLAEKLAYPEHQLRRLINGHLGYRNFTAFLNSYRIAEARKQLADPEKARTPVLTIALNLGYASLGPFNRAFKADTGKTPTDYRREALNSADSE